MKANAVSALVLGAFLCTASAVVAQTPVGALTIDADQGVRYGWAVDFGGTGAVQVGALGDCGAGCSVVPSRGGRTTGYLGNASAPGPRAYRRPSSGERQRRSPPSSFEVESVFWDSIATSTNPADFEAYLAQFPDGVYRALAEARLSGLRSASGGDPPRRSGGVFRDCPSCPEMVVIPAGEFQMGSSPGESVLEYDVPRHRVRVERFALGRYEVTRAEYAAFAAATGRDPDWCFGGPVDAADWRAPGYPQTDEHPVVCVSWDDAQAYVRWLSRETGASYRLPSEAEWEYAARGGTTTRWYWGGDATEQCGNANGADAAARRRFGDWTWTQPCDDGRVFTAPVGTFGANGFGLFDVAGNAAEWVEDCWHDNYSGAPADGRAWTTGGDCDSRVLRGGSWRGIPTDDLSSAGRGRSVLSSNEQGFRVARTLD